MAILARIQKLAHPEVAHVWRYEINHRLGSLETLVIPAGPNAASKGSCGTAGTAGGLGYGELVLVFLLIYIWFCWCFDSWRSLLFRLDKADRREQGTVTKAEW